MHAAASASGDELDRRLARLRREWDMERTLEFNASIAAGIGACSWLAGPAASAASLQEQERRGALGAGPEGTPAHLFERCSCATPTRYRRAPQAWRWA